MSIDVWEERRQKVDKKHGDVRTEWERDYARLIHSSAFRRLQSKTQVLGLGESDFYRTRLTHSMEVAQIGVGILRTLIDKYKDNDEIKNTLPDPALMNSICLAHDIGHPPFGHGGEVALNVCMRGYGGFEGNGQTLRILSKLDKYTESHGMNPTRRLLLGVLKYPASYNDTVQSTAYGDLPTRRWLCQAKKQHPPKCYLNDEQDIVSWILEPLAEKERELFTSTEFNENTGHFKPRFKGLDTSIMELADDISYSLHDLEDAISLGMVTRKDWDEHFQKAKDFSSCGFNNQLVADDLFSDYSYKRKHQIGCLVHKFITNIEVKKSDCQSAVMGLIKWNAVMDTAYDELRDHIFDLVKQKVIKSPNVQQLEFKGQKLVMELFEALESDPERLLPRSTLDRYRDASSYSNKIRVICDYVSGMTDDYATRLYEKIYFPHKGSIFDRL